MNSHDLTLRDAEATLPGMARQPNPYIGYGGDDVDDGFNPVQLLWYVVHYRWLFALLLFCGIVGGTLFTWMQTPTFEARTTVEVLVTGPRVLDELETVQQSSDVLAL
ncbi:MAG: hypothetical protein AAFO77_13965, partial [Pseudomonadota bacterium]